MKNIATLYIENFQSHGQTKINFSDGLNIFVGESDNGKSAIIRALRWLYYNEPKGNSFIRVGQTRCEVTVILKDGTKVSRIRDEKLKKNRYVLEEPGKEALVFEKFKNEVPLEIQKALGVYKLWVDKDKGIELNIARQLDPPFLIAETGSTRAKIIGRIANLHIIDAAMRDLNKDIRNYGRKKAELEELIKDTQTKLEDYNDLPIHEENLEQIKFKLKRITQLEEKVKQLQTISNDITITQAKIEDSNNTLSRLAKIAHAEKQLDLINKAYLFYSQLNDLQTVRDSCLEEINRYKSIISSLELDNTETQQDLLKNKNEKQETLQVLCHQMNMKRALITEAETILNNTQNLDKVVNNIQKLYSLREKGVLLQQKKKEISAVYLDIKEKRIILEETTTTLNKIKDLNVAETNLANATHKTKQLELLVILNQEHSLLIERKKASDAELNKLEATYSELIEKYVETLKETGKCPMCLSKIDDERAELIGKEIKALI